MTESQLLNDENSSNKSDCKNSPSRWVLFAILIAMTSEQLLSLSILTFLPPYIRDRNEIDEFEISQGTVGSIIS